MLLGLLAFVACRDARAGKTITFVDTAGGANFQEFHVSWTLPQANRQLPFKVEYVVSSGAEVIERLKAQTPGRGDLHVVLLKPDAFVGTLEAGIPLETLAGNPAIPNAAKIPARDLEEIHGVPSQGKGLQFWRDQAGFIYNTARIPHPPTSFAELYERRQEFCGHIGVIRLDAKSAGGRLFLYDFLHAFGVDWTKPFAELRGSGAWGDAIARFSELSTCFYKPLAPEPPYLFEQFLKEDVWIAEYAIDYTLWSKERGKLPKTVATTYATEGIHGGNAILVVPSSIPDDNKALAFSFVNLLLSDDVQRRLFLSMRQYPGTDIWDALPEEAWADLPKMADLNRTRLENYEGVDWIKRNGMGLIQ